MTIRRDVDYIEVQRYAASPSGLLLRVVLVFPDLVIIPASCLTRTRCALCSSAPRDLILYVHTWFPALLHYIRISTLYLPTHKYVRKHSQNRHSVLTTRLTPSSGLHSLASLRLFGRLCRALTPVAVDASPVERH